MSRIFICPNCKSDELTSDANARWVSKNQRWELNAVFDSKTCHTCGQKTNNPDIEELPDAAPTGPQNRPMMTAEQALAAIRARLQGEYDQPDLMAFGPLSSNIIADCLEIAETAATNS